MSVFCLHSSTGLFCSATIKQSQRERISLSQEAYRNMHSEGQISQLHNPDNISPKSKPQKGKIGQKRKPEPDIAELESIYSTVWEWWSEMECILIPKMLFSSSQLSQSNVRLSELQE